MPEMAYVKPSEEVAEEPTARQLAWLHHPHAMHGLRCVNTLVALVGLAILGLVVYLLAIEDGSGSAASLAPFITVGGVISFIGLLGMAGTKYGNLLKAYWLANFFGIVLATWVVAYAAFNFSKIEHQTMLHFEAHWGNMVNALPETLKGAIPISCGGNSTEVLLESWSSEQFEANCWNTIKDTIMSNLHVVAICIGVALLMQLLCAYWIVTILTVAQAIGLVRGAIDVGMTCVGSVLVLAGVALLSEFGTIADTLYMAVAFLTLGGLIVVLGCVFGCCSSSSRRCAKIAAWLYGVLFFVLAALAFACIANEDAIRAHATEHGKDWLFKLCDKPCFEKIYTEMMASRGGSGSRQCEEPHPGDSECQAEYDWSIDRLEDPACNSTAPNTISDDCLCPCDYARETKEAAANARQATEEYIISIWTDDLNLIGWGCILVSIYMLVECGCHYYNMVRNAEPENAYGGLDSSRECPDSANP